MSAKFDNIQTRHVISSLKLIFFYVWNMNVNIQNSECYPIPMTFYCIQLLINTFE